uniref:Uncharacterized protein n=1 Tax=Aegilops tauschii subsp. strangulata TaxID=200361 RepID=A0A452YU05_AEGTS
MHHCHLEHGSDNVIAGGSSARHDDENEAGMEWRQSRRTRRVCTRQKDTNFYYMTIKRTRFDVY